MTQFADLAPTILQVHYATTVRGRDGGTEGRRDGGWKERQRERENERTRERENERKRRREGCVERTRDRENERKREEERGVCVDERPNGTSRRENPKTDERRSHVLYDPAECPLAPSEFVRRNSTTTLDHQSVFLRMVFILEFILEFI